MTLLDLALTGRPKLRRGHYYYYCAFGAELTDSLILGVYLTYDGFKSRAD